MAQDSNQATVEKVGSAALKGAGAAVNHKIIEPLSALIEPGDMNPAHMPHPLDDAAARLSNLPGRLGGLTEPKDMNIANSPHPVDATLAAANKSINQVKSAGPIKGTELAAELVVGAVIDSANPGKKLEVADKIFDATGQVRHVEGHLVDEITTGKGVVHHEVESSKTGLAKLKEQAAGIVKRVPVLGDVVNPDFETRVAIEQYKLKPTTDDILRAKHLGNPSDIDHAQNAIGKSAEDLIKKAKENPELAQQLNGQLTNAQIRNGIVNNTQKENLLAHDGASRAGNYTPDVPPPSVKDFLPMSARDAAHLVFLPQNPSPERMARYQELLNAEYASHATKVQMAGVPYAWASAGGGSIALANYVASSAGEGGKSNPELSKTFQEAVVKNSDKAMQQLGHDNPELKGAALYYQSAKNGLTSDDGRLSDGDKATLAKVADNVIEKIKTEGPQIFDKPPQNLTQQEVTHSEVLHQEHTR